jgi:predicted enzyme related to lactoylglutathione lyase
MKKTYKEGMFCWQELISTDSEASKAFYCDLFAWTAEDLELGDVGTYTVFSSEGSRVAALRQVSETEKAAGGFSHWVTYLYVRSLSGALERLVKNGAKLVVEPYSVGDLGKAAVVTDVTGAFLSLWEANSLQGAEESCVPNTMAWVELYSTDALASKKFYTDVFDYQVEETPMMGDFYRNFIIDGEYSCGLLQINSTMGGMPSNWATYFQVKDCSQTISKATELGAVLSIPPADVPGKGVFAGLQDPQGACLLVQQGFYG